MAASCLKGLLGGWKTLLRRTHRHWQVEIQAGGDSGSLHASKSEQGPHALSLGSLLQSSGDALKKAESMVASLLAQGYIVGKDAMEKARALDAQHALSAQARGHAEMLSKGAADLDSKYSISKKIAETSASMSKSLSTVDDKYQVTSKTKEALTAAEHSLSEAGQYVMQNKYVASSTSWLVGALGQLKTIVADVQQQAAEKVIMAEEERAGGQGAQGRPGGEQEGGAATPGMAEHGHAFAQDAPTPGLASGTSLIDNPTGQRNVGTQRDPLPPSAAKPTFTSADPPLF